MTLADAPFVMDFARASAEPPEDGIGPRAMTGTWALLRVKPHKVRTYLQSMGILSDIGFYRPMRWRAWRDPETNRKRKKAAALFPAYIFACYSDTSDLDVLRRPEGFQNRFPVNNQKKTVEEIATIHDAFVAGLEVGAAIPLAVGQRCRVISGPFQGMKGTLTDADRKFVLDLKILGRSVPTEIPWDKLEPIEDD